MLRFTRMAHTVTHSKRFADVLVFDGNEKTVISSRDGVSEYLGSELGIAPPDKRFTVYRSPAIVANMAMRMPGIPVVDSHQMVNGIAEVGPEGGKVEDAQMVDEIDTALHSTIAVKNRITLSDALLAEVEAGKRELSVDGTWQLGTHETFDFAVLEQHPEHLAVCERARQGPNMRFLDSKPKEKTMKLRDKLKSKSAQTAFCDAEGEINLQAVAEVVAGIPEAIKAMSLEKLQELMPVLMEAIEAAKAGGAKTEAEVGDEGKEKTEPSDEEKKKLADEAAAKDAEKKEGDEKKFGDAVTKKAQEFTDAAIAQRDDVIEKARLFVDAQFVFKGKPTAEIMRAVLAIDHPTEKFTDAELSTAFKLLKPKGADYSKFGDTKPSGFDALKGKQL